MEDAKRQTLARIVRAGAEEMLPRQLALLEQICAIDSGTGNEAGNAAVTGLLEPVLSELGARTERVTEPGLGTHLVARVRPEQPRGKVLLAAHLDTVFGPGFAEKHPFHIEGEWAHGLGAGDCKSGVLISLFGALILKKAGLLPPWELTYLFTCDEETGSRSGRKVYAREAQDAALALVFEGAGRTSPVCHIPPGGDSGNRRRGGAGGPCGQGVSGGPQRRAGAGSPDHPAIQLQRL